MKPPLPSTLLTIATAMLFQSVSFAEDPCGSFSGEAVIEWLDETQTRLELKEDLSFTDCEGEVWTVPKGTRYRGASIPAELTEFLGHPLAGPYQRAAILHGYFTAKENRIRASRKTNLMFYQACLADGLERWQAGTAYWTVSVGGPRWNLRKRAFGDDEVVELQQGSVKASEIQVAMNYIKEKDLDPELIIRLKLQY